MAIGYRELSCMYYGNNNGQKEIAQKQWRRRTCYRKTTGIAITKVTAFVILLFASIGCNEEVTPPVVEVEVDCSDKPDYTTTFAAIQGNILEPYNCTNSVCHGATPFSGNLDLTTENSYASLVGAPSSSSELKRVEPGNHDLSLLYQKLEAGSMPAGGNPQLSPAHLAAIYLWIEDGAPQDTVVAGTEPILGPCTADVAPVEFSSLEPPAAGTGIQLQSSSWELSAQSEKEVCVATFYDFTTTDLVPANEQIDCPEGISENNPSGKCFRFNKLAINGGPMSHHEISYLYTGNKGLKEANFWTGEPFFGPFTYKMKDLTDPKNGLTCEPYDVDETGQLLGCSGKVEEIAGCGLSYGPLNFATARTRLTVTMRDYEEFSYASGVYDIFPMSGIVVWNPHAFNLSSFDTTVTHYLNFEFALQPSNQLYPIQREFDARNIYEVDVAPFTAEEICMTTKYPEGAKVFELTSHTHKRGVQWRMWAPPNTPCDPGDSACVAPDGPDADDRLIMTSIGYAEPEIIVLDPPVVLDSTSSADRSYLSCVVYDNGSTPTSPAVKQQSTSLPKPADSSVDVGGPCENNAVACMDGPQKGQLCGGDNTFCDTTEGAGDGLCDACPVTGGYTSDDEMLLPLGYYHF